MLSESSVVGIIDVWIIEGHCSIISEVYRKKFELLRYIEQNPSNDIPDYIPPNMVQLVSMLDPIPSDELRGIFEEYGQDFVCELDYRIITPLVTIFLEKENGTTFKIPRIIGTNGEVLRDMEFKHMWEDYRSTCLLAVHKVLRLFKYLMANRDSLTYAGVGNCIKTYGLSRIS